jgi:hypothetical protein
VPRHAHARGPRDGGEHRPFAVRAKEHRMKLQDRFCSARHMLGAEVPRCGLSTAMVRDTVECGESG